MRPGRCKNRILLAFFAAAFWASGGAAYAFPLYEFYRGVRPMAMGNAFTAVSDDDDALFYNPAGIAFNQTLKFKLLDMKIEGSQDDITSISTIRDISSNGLNSSNMSQLFGKNYYAGMTNFSGIYFPNFVLGYYAAGDLHLMATNPALPQVQLSYMYDRGVVSGFGFETMGLAKKQYLRFGLTGKWLTRIGYQGTIPIIALANTSTSYIKSLKSESANGFSLSAGLQYEMTFGRNDAITVGTSWLDIGDTTFGGYAVTNPPPKIPNNLTAGFAWVHYFGASTFDNYANFKLTAEGRHLSQSNINPLLKAHIGSEVDLGIVAFQAGINQDSLCGGASVDLLLFKASAATYGVQNTNVPFLDRERRYVAQFTLKFDLLGRQGRSLRASEADRKKHPRNY